MLVELVPPGPGVTSNTGEYVAMTDSAPEPAARVTTAEQGERSRERQRRLGLVEPVDALRTEPVRGERQKRLSARRR